MERVKICIYIMCVIKGKCVNGNKYYEGNVYKLK